MKKPCVILSFLLFTFVILLLSSCMSSNQSLQDDPDNQPRIDFNDLPHKAYGYANVYGTKLILLYDPELDDNSQLNHFKYAVGENGISFEVDYELFQELNFNSTTGRQTMWNFENEQGCVYTVKDTVAVPNDTYMLLTKEEYEKTVIAQEITKAPEYNPIYEIEAECEQKANRKIKDSWILTEYQSGLQIVMLVFENIEESLLAWLVVKDGDRLDYCEFPATYDGLSGWSMEDNGTLKEDYFSILCTLQNDQIIIVYLNWFDFEGNVVYELSFIPETKCSKRIVCGRYTSPL